MERIIIPVCLFATIFGVFYIYLSTRNRERLALIEKGADASLFKSSPQNVPVWKLLLLNLSLLLIGIGIGLLIISILHAYTLLDSEAANTAIVFIMAGISLFTGFTLSKKLEK
ncbi:MULTISPECIES: DUF6249 domain-containing protein [Flavobacterium]|jgi:hypothetical protein|uniref:DUF6249 domain-containing protein n=1 Tax=Flavobacterium lindanitolerans TaxID=428988 RepID=A0A497UP15_9FLAO|nr:MULTISPECIES: DUF6249 domain-containing protein [Flavobacterium]MBU7570726.1 hypothetical protein [Flavobacterium sp.]PZO32169.1 MAG: hypothetical protein DCE86_07990 [Flavobacteriaceae bacterium]PZQ79155.1 MAG: hypothetical protein DI548_15205 [Flavobacterium johnsoniae]KQS53209.1 hypothetical protein ASG38_00210 [Flavobacterium sp. Leaf359]MBC8644263.1 hypothetical protein [Flavobacterium lindanitolerans]